MDNVAPKQLKLTAEECCEQLLTDPILKQGMLRLLLLFKELKMKPCWYHAKSYKCNYKGERVLYINFGKQNWLRIRVCTVGDMHGVGEFDLYLDMLEDELRNEFMNYAANFKRCCKSGKGCGVCGKSRTYYITNPTEEQFEWIEKFIFVRREFIEQTKKHRG